MRLLILTSKSNRHNYLAYKISKYFNNFKEKNGLLKKLDSQINEKF